MIDNIKKTYQGSEAEFFRVASDALEQDKKMFVVTANAETMMIAHRTPEFEALMADEEVTIIPDGIGLVKGMEKLGMKTNGRVTGVALAEHLLSEASRLHKSVYLYGAKQEVIDKLEEILKTKFSGAVVAGLKNGYDHKGDRVFSDIAAKQPDVVLVALGIPAQELLIYKHLAKFQKGIFVGVGGSFDVISGTKKRAPKLFIKLNLEWLYRMLCEPTRIKRFCNSHLKFLPTLDKEIKARKKQEKSK